MYFKIPKRINYFGVVNDIPAKEFEVSRGLRKGDPLSPFIFLMIAEVFNLLMNKAVDLGNFVCYKFNGREFFFSHVQYAEETLIIWSKVWGNIRTIKENFFYYLMLQLNLNFHKSCLVDINICHCWIKEADNILNYMIRCILLIILVF